MTRSAPLLLALGLVGVVAAPVRAQVDLPPPVNSGAADDAESGGTERPSADDGEHGTALATYLDALAQRRLLASETGSVERMRDIVRRGETLHLDGLHDAAALLLFEVAESPRFADFVELPEFRGAELMLARSLEQLGALRTASRYLERILERGPEDVYFGPAFRAFVDVALSSGDPSRGAERLAELGVENLTEDAENEQRYLVGRAAYDRREFEDAEAALAQVTERSRWFAPAQYLRGVMKAKQGDLPGAEEHFCSIATQEDQDSFTFFVDDRYFEVKDLARLALGRVAHEGGRAEDAFYYYFQVPQDSDRVAEALFEAAYSMYEGNDMETAVDLLDQLEARYPESPFVDEAMLLRGYVHLGRCEFEEADRLFRRFAQNFGPLVSHIDAILESPSRQETVYEELLVAERRAEERRDRGEPAAQGERPEGEEADDRGATIQRLLFAMLRVDPAFYRLHADVRTLEAEGARAGRLAMELNEILGRVRGTDRPVAAAAADDPWVEGADVERQLDDAKAILASLTAQLDAMRAAEAPATEIRPLQQEVRQLSQRVAALEGRFHEAMAAMPAEEASGAEPGNDFEALLERDAGRARNLPARVASTRARMVVAANESALHALRTLRRRLGGELRRARIGRIDAVMGSKRRIEIQIESLAAGRFPPELLDPLRVQGLLRDDEEYWPFEGELWQDEFDETDPIEELEEEAAEEEAE